MTLVVKTLIPPSAVAAAIKRSVREVDPDLGLGPARTVQSIVAAARGIETFVGILLIGAAAVALLLSATGVYGSVAHVVRRRIREIGIRVALGAGSAEVLRVVCGAPVRAAAIGSVFGLLLARASAQGLTSVLFGVRPNDPESLTGAVALLLLVSTGAALLAARRAIRVSPVRALRGQLHE